MVRKKLEDKGEDIGWDKDLRLNHIRLSKEKEQLTEKLEQLKKDNEKLSKELISAKGKSDQYIKTNEKPNDINPQSADKNIAVSDEPAVKGFGNLVKRLIRR